MLRSGIDLIEIERIATTLERHGERFLQRVFTEREIERYGPRIASLAVRWAAKEAVAKVLGCGIGAVGWKEIEILSDERGAPQLHLHGHAALMAAELGISEWALSLSHTRYYAIAMVVAQGEGGVREGSPPHFTFVSG
ncbi:MAG: holo-[acyl-carrier-protein] synthase [Chloroflexi bacterium]|nr:holo-[acyl-carrier-protein] synthase [Chloroflexota bacterium]